MIAHSLTLIVLYLSHCMLLQSLCSIDLSHVFLSVCNLQKAVNKYEAEKMKENYKDFAYFLQVGL